MSKQKWARTLLVALLLSPIAVVVGLGTSRVFAENTLLTSGNGSTCVAYTAKWLNDDATFSFTGGYTIEMKCNLHTTNSTGDAGLTAMSNGQGTCGAMKLGCAGGGSNAAMQTTVYMASGGSAANVAWDNCATQTITKWGDIKSSTGATIRSNSGHGLKPNAIRLTVTCAGFSYTESGNVNLAIYLPFFQSNNLGMNIAGSKACGEPNQTVGYDICYGSDDTTAWGTDAIYPDYWAGQEPPLDPCDAFSAAWTPSGDVQQTTGNQSVTLTRSAAEAAEDPLSGFFWGYNWNYGYDGTLTTFWQQLQPTRVASPYRLAGDEQTVNFSVPFSNSWSDGWNTYFNISCFHVSSGYAKARTFRRGTTGGLTTLVTQRPCSFVGVTFPSQTSDTSALFRVGVSFAPATGEPIASGGVVSLTPSREVGGAWVDESFDTYLNPLTGTSITSPLPITATRLPFVASSTLTGGALAGSTGRWSVLCEDLAGKLRIKAPLNGGSSTVGPTAVGPAGDPYYDSGPGSGESIDLPNGLPSGASTPGDGASGAGADNDGNGDGVNDDLEGVGYGEGDCDAGFGYSPLSWAPALIKSFHCVMIGLFVPSEDALDFLTDIKSDSVLEDVEVAYTIGEGLIGITAVPAGSCAGDAVTIPLAPGAELESNMFDACDSPASYVRDLVWWLVTLTTTVWAVRASIRLILGAFGLYQAENTVTVYER